MATDPGASPLERTVFGVVFITLGLATYPLARAFYAVPDSAAALEVKQRLHSERLDAERYPATTTGTITSLNVRELDVVERALGDTHGVAAGNAAVGHAAIGYQVGDKSYEVRDIVPTTAKEGDPVLLIYHPDRPADAQYRLPRRSAPPPPRPSLLPFTLLALLLVGVGAGVFASGIQARRRERGR